MGGLRNYGLITSITELARFCERLGASDDPIAYDIETGYRGPDQAKASLHPETAIVVGISFTSSTDWARYVPLAHDHADNLDNREAARLLWPLLASGRGVGHNLAFELRHLSRWFCENLADDPDYGEAVRACNGYYRIRSCTQVEAYLAAESQFFGLKPLVQKLFGHTMVELYELFPDLPINRRKFIRFNPLDPTDPNVYSYACEDSVWALAVHQRYYYQLQVDRPDLFNIERRIVQDVLHEMEDFGVAYDWVAMARGSEELTSFRDKFNAEIMTELSERLGGTVALNLNSSAQLSDLLFNRLGLSTARYTAKTRDLPPDQRKMSTDKIALAGMVRRDPIVRKIADWKEMSKLKGTYLEKYEGLYNYASDGRTHPNHLSAFVITGRFAVSEPAYQQSPKKYHYDLAPAKAAHAAHADAHGPKCKCEEYPPPPGTCFRFNFRDCIIAPPEHYIIGFDLSQAELRAVAGEAKEEALLRAFANGDDVHTLTASLMLGIPIDEITSDDRDVGKTLNFAIIYGLSIKGLAERLNRTRDEAQVLYDKFFQAYPAIAVWSAAQVRKARANGYVTSRFGRKLPIWEYQSDKRWIQQKGDRAAVNYPIQGAATGDYMKIAMLRARQALIDTGLHDRVHLVMNVHDALEFYVHQSVQIQQVINVLREAVIFPVTGWPAMRADWHIGARWGSLLAIEITDDGRFLVKGEHVQELTPMVEEDEETGEEIVVLPEVSDEAITRAIERIVAGEGGRHVIAELPDMPNEDAYLRFCSLVDSRPGPNILTLRTPEGDLDISTGTSLDLDDLAEISLHLGPTKLYIDAADINLGDLVHDITF